MARSMKELTYRNLEVMSWMGFNILGNMDGQVLDNPGNMESKIRTKDRVLSKILGYSPHLDRPVYILIPATAGCRRRLAERAIHTT